MIHASHSCVSAVEPNTSSPEIWRYNGAETMKANCKINGTHMSSSLDKNVHVPHISEHFWYVLHEQWSKGFAFDDCKINQEAFLLWKCFVQEE